ARPGHNRAYHGLWSQGDQIPANAVAPHAVGQEAEALEQFVIEGRYTAAANLRVAAKLRATHGQNSSLHKGRHAAQFDVEVAAAGLGVPGEFGIDIRADIWRAGVVVSVKLRAQLGVEGKRKDHRPGGDELLRVFDSEAPCKIIVGMPDRPELAGAGVVDPYMDVGVFTQTQSEIAGHGREANTVRSQQTPALSAQELPLAPLEVQPIETQARRVGVGAYE